MRPLSLEDTDLRIILSSPPPFTLVGYIQASTVIFDGLKALEFPIPTTALEPLKFPAGPNLPAVHPTFDALPVYPLPELSLILLPFPSWKCQRPTVFPSVGSGITSLMVKDGVVAEAYP